MTERIDKEWQRLNKARGGCYSRELTKEEEVEEEDAEEADSSGLSGSSLLVLAGHHRDCKSPPKLERM